MSVNKELNDLLKEERSSSSKGQSSPSVLNKYFNHDAVDNQDSTNINNNGTVNLELEEKTAKLCSAEKQVTIMTKLPNDVHPRPEEENQKNEKVDTPTNGNDTSHNSPCSFDSKSTSNSNNLDPTRQVEAKDQNNIYQGRLGKAMLPKPMKPSDTLQSLHDTLEHPGKVDVQPTDVTKNKVDEKAARGSESKNSVGTSTSESKMNDAQSSSRKRQPLDTTSRSLDIPEIHEFNPSTDKVPSVKPKLLGQKTSRRPSVPVVEEEKSIHNSNNRRKMFSTSVNPFFHNSQFPENRRTARRFSEMDHRKVFEMPNWQRKLSQLFVPPSQEELRDTVEDSQKLLNGRKVPTIAPLRPRRGSKISEKHQKKGLHTSNQEEQEENDRLDVLDGIQGSDCFSTESTNTASISTASTSTESTSTASTSTASTSSASTSSASTNIQFFNVDSFRQVN
ncbi:hypothetical protein FHG87_003539 [Trinorchestia longiramus]|nr:hypothetical protein FHG87_003539 [Trinorchestia longiramus]